MTSEPVAFPDPATARVAVIGLGYVGLPLTLGFAKGSRAIGFDINEKKVTELKSGIDFTGEVTNSELVEADADFTTDATALADADVIIVCVPDTCEQPQPARLRSVDCRLQDHRQAHEAWCRRGL